MARLASGKMAAGTGTREREHATLSFTRPEGRGAAQETFYPWDLTVRRFVEEGLPQDLADRLLGAGPGGPEEKYLVAGRFEAVADYERWLGLDPVRRVAFLLPLREVQEVVLEDTPEHTLFRDEAGRVISRHKWSGVEVHDSYAVKSREDWYVLENLAREAEAAYYDRSSVRATYGPLRPGQARGEYSVRMHIEGFFWTPRELMGTEGLSYALYDMPDLVHRVNEFCLGMFLAHLPDVLDALPADVLYIQEDISGTNGPLISPRMFDEFVAPYYERLVPVLRHHGVRHVLVDTDGDFRRLVPNFMKVGVDGFLPLDVNAGMDIVSLRDEYPRLQLIGGFNKLSIAEGPGAIDKEFERLLPVIRQGGYIPGADHQVAPSTSLGDYRYYLGRLKEVMAESGLGPTTRPGPAAGGP